MFEVVLLLLAVISPWIFNKLTLPSWISVVLLCYALGLGMSAIIGPPHVLHGPIHSLIQACVVLAIPAMLLSASWTQLRRLGSTGFKAAISLWIGAAVAAFTLLFVANIDADRIGMILAIFTGGLANLQAAGLVLGFDEFNLVAANLGDVIAGGFLFMVLTSVGWPVIHWIFTGTRPPDNKLGATNHTASDIVEKVTPSAYAKAFGLAIACVALAAGVSIILPANYLELGVLGLGALLAISVGERLATKNKGKDDGATEQIAQAGQNLGEYLMLVFCVLIGWSANWTAVGPEALVWASQMGLFLAIQVMVSLVLAKALRVNPALYLMALVGCIYSPAFVPPIASTTRRYDLVSSGVFIGLIGLATGTLIGVLFARGFA